MAGESATDMHIEVRLPGGPAALLQRPDGSTRNVLGWRLTARLWRALHE